MELMDSQIYVLESVVLGKEGIEKIVEIDLSDAEKEHMKVSAAGVSKTNGLLEL